MIWLPLRPLRPRISRMADVSYAVTVGDIREILRKSIPGTARAGLSIRRRRRPEQRALIEGRRPESARPVLVLTDTWAAEPSIWKRPVIVHKNGQLRLKDLGRAHCPGEDRIDGDRANGQKTCGGPHCVSPPGRRCSKLRAGLLAADAGKVRAGRGIDIVPIYDQGVSCARRTKTSATPFLIGVKCISPTIS